MNFFDKVLKFISSSKFYGPIIVIIGFFLVYSIISKVLDRIILGKKKSDKKKRMTILILFKNIIKYSMVIVSVLIILNIYGVNTTSLLAGLGIAGVVIGLALQDALKDIIGGVNIIMDDYYSVGDLVDINGFTGTVIDFGLKATKVQKFDGEVLIIANRNIDKVVNMSKEKPIVVISVPTAYECDVEEVEKVLNGVIKDLLKLDYVDKDDTKYLGIDEFASSAINFKFQAKCDFGKQFELKRTILRMIKIAYDKNNIKIPYDQIEVHYDK